MEGLVSMYDCEDIYGKIRMILVCSACECEVETGEEVECTNIESNIYGEDVVTFICPECGEEVKSLVVTRR